MMFDSIRHVLKTSIEVYHDGKRTEWMVSHCGQCVLNGSQVHWTKEVEEAMNENQLPKYLQQLEEQLLDSVELVRGKMTKLLSITMGALITIDVHAKEVIERLVKE